MKKVGLMVVLALVALACGETVGGMMQDAGAMLADAGDMMQPDAGAQDTPVQCDKSSTSGDPELTYHWAEFPVTPGQTEITICYGGNPDSYGPSKRDTCNRLVSPWYEGTNTGAIHCGGNVTSITVHN
jgi:hypothetical protein